MYRSIARLVGIVLVSVVLASCGSQDAQKPAEPPLTVEDLSPPDQPGSQPLGPPRDLQYDVPGSQFENYERLTTTLQRMAQASLLDDDVWASTDSDAAAIAVIAPFNDLVDGGADAKDILDSLSDEDLDGSTGITRIASVFPPDAQPEEAPTIYKATWEVKEVDDEEGESDSVRFRLTVWAGYTVPMKATQSPIVVGRRFDLTISRTDGGNNRYLLNVGVNGRIADLCAAVVDGELRPTERLPEKAIEMLHTEFMSDEATSPADVATALNESNGVDSDEVDDREAACLAKADRS